MNVIIDYNAGNIASLQNALEKLSIRYVVSSDASVISSADKVLFPGQGHIGQAMKNLKERGLVDVMKNLKQPFLGICVGAQLLFESSEEGNTSALGIIPGTIKRFPVSLGLKVPHIGWNTVNLEYFYFVHSYFLPKNEFTVAETKYGLNFAAIVKRNNFIGVQFHPEKSGAAGHKFLKNFLCS